ncbi:MAG TPA: hypothetical protein VFR19_25055 [Hyphomicrobiaceae bacterium]|nr:hypothetical protein [Hyphomicrobiaceae bacterium]
MAFPILAFVFGLLFYAASSGLMALTLAAMAAWLWWAALIPLALCHAASGFLAMTTATGSQPSPTRTVRVGALASIATTLVTLLAAVWTAIAVPVAMSRDTALAVVLLAQLGGFAGLVVAWQISRRCLLRVPQPPEN